MREREKEGCSFERYLTVTTLRGGINGNARWPLMIYYDKPLITARRNGNQYLSFSDPRTRLRDPKCAVPRFRVCKLLRWKQEMLRRTECACLSLYTRGTICLHNAIKDANRHLAVIKCGRETRVSSCLDHIARRTRDMVFNVTFKTAFT